MWIPSVETPLKFPQDGEPLQGTNGFVAGACLEGWARNLRSWWHLKFQAIIQGSRFVPATDGTYGSINTSNWWVSRVVPSGNFQYLFTATRFQICSRNTQMVPSWIQILVFHHQALAAGSCRLNSIPLRATETKTSKNSSALWRDYEFTVIPGMNSLRRPLFPVKGVVTGIGEMVSIQDLPWDPW